MSIQTMEKNTKSKKKNSLDFSKEQYIKWYKDMLVMRKVEERVGHLYIQQKFGGFCHLYIGQEAIVAGTVSACQKEDKHITAYSCLLYTSPSPRDKSSSRMPSSA